MKATCQLCGEAVHGRDIAELMGKDPATLEGQVLDYDALSAHMWLHISERHPNQMEEGIMQQRRAAKMYAMNWATIPGELEPVRQQHRANLLIGLTVTTQFAGDQAAAPAAGSAESPGDGSNEKKSVRNTSN